LSESTETICCGVRAPPKKKLEVERAPKKNREDTFEFQWELQVGSKWLHEVIAKLTSEEKHQYEQEPCGQCVGFVVRPVCEYEQVAPGTNAEYQNRKQKIREPDCDNRVGLHGQD